MDPVSLSAKQFRADIDAFWKPRPGAPVAPGPRVLRLVASPSERGELLKTLRWIEWFSENRRPIILFEELFEDEPRYLRALIAKTADDCEAVQQGLAEDAILLPTLPTKPAEAGLDATTAGRYVNAAAECMVGGSLDGILLALVPKRITHPKAYRATLAKLTAVPMGAALRLAVLDIPGAELGALLPAEARFEVDQAELFAFLKRAGPKASEGSAVPKPSWSSAVSSRHTDETLRALLLDAGQALAEGKAACAAQRFKAAQTTIDVLPLVEEAQRMQQQCRVLERVSGEETPHSRSHKESVIPH